MVITHAAACMRWKEFWTAAGNVSKLGTLGDGKILCRCCAFSVSSQFSSSLQLCVSDPTQPFNPLLSLLITPPLSGP